jgi:glycosyltransferase involved in cell wall biosynthesis
MRVVMVLGRSTGGIGTHVADLSARLEGLGEEVQVVTEAHTAEHFGLTTARLWYPGRGAGVWGSLRGMARLRRLAATADVVHAHGHQAGLVAVLATLGLSTPVVVSQHNAVLGGGSGVRRRVSDLVQRVVARRATLVTGASSDLVAAARSFGARHTELADVPSPRVPALLAAPVEGPAARRAGARDILRDNGIRETGPLVLTISRIAPQKSLDVLVAAAASSPDATWVVVGSGDDDLLAALREQAAQSGAPVHFVGAVPDPTRWLVASEVFVLPSQWEARALVVQESMAAGTPVVATDTGGLRDLVADAGLLVPVGDAAALAGAVERLVGDPGLRDSCARRGRTVAASWDDSEATARRWRQWYAALRRMT